MKNPLPESPVNFGDWARIAIAKHFNKILKHESGVLKDKDPEHLHQMRVGMRRLRSAIAGFDRAVDLPEGASEKAVGKLGKTLGALRDLDVMQETLTQQYLSLLADGEQKKLKKALSALKANRSDAFQQTKKLLKGDRYAEFKSSCQQWLDAPELRSVAALPLPSVLPDLLSPPVSNLLLHEGWMVGVRTFDGQVSVSNRLAPESVRDLLVANALLLHDLRKTAKRSRYNLELFAPSYGESYQSHVRTIQALQEVLGHLQDSYVLSDFLSEQFERDWTKSLPTLAAELDRRRYRHWLDWQNSQFHFLNADTRHNLRWTILHPAMPAYTSDRN